MKNFFVELKSKIFIEL